MPLPAEKEPDRRVVVVDDDEVMLLSCQEILTRAGYKVETFNRGAPGLECIRLTRPPVVIVDLKMPEIDGFEVIRQVRELDPTIVIIVITGYATVATAVDAMKAGAYDFLPKPFTPDELRLIVARGYERFRLQRESEALRREKEAAERRFITFVSHQLKTPLVAVKQYLDVLLYTSRADLPDRVAEWLERSRVRLDEMLALIEDWLQLARIERGELCCAGEKSDLGDVVRKAASGLSPLADSKGVRIEVQVQPDLPFVRGDNLSLASLVTNLLSNAIKYNRPGGSVSVTATVAEGGALLEVSDTGIGIPAEEIPYLFNEFHRVKNDATRDIPGTGLGLAICRRIVSELGGRIEVQSEVGKGSKFSVWLQAASPESAKGLKT